MTFSSLIRVCIYILLFVSIIACQRSDPEVFKQKARCVIEELINELEIVQDEQDFLSKQQDIELLFHRLVDAIIEVRKLEAKCQKQMDLVEEDKLRSSRLRHELGRIYRIDGGKEWIERCQSDAVERLNSFERKLVHLKEAKIRN